MRNDFVYIRSFDRIVPISIKYTGIVIYHSYFDFIYVEITKELVMSIVFFLLVCI